jgi:hypothetical protein
MALPEVLVMTFSLTNSVSGSLKGVVVIALNVGIVAFHATANDVDERIKATVAAEAMNP